MGFEGLEYGVVYRCDRDLQNEHSTHTVGHGYAFIVGSDSKTLTPFPSSKRQEVADDGGRGGTLVVLKLVEDLLAELNGYDIVIISWSCVVVYRMVQKPEGRLGGGTGRVSFGTCGCWHPYLQM